MLNRLTLAILVPQQPVMSSVAAFVDLFRHANTYINQLGLTGLPQFEVGLYSATGGWVGDGGLAVNTAPASSLAGLQPDAVIISAPLILDGKGLHQALAEFAVFTPWLRDVAATGRPLASACAGSLLLAGTGLLEGRRATTAWWLAALFDKHFPGVELTLDRLIVDDGQFVTAGASTASYSLGLALLSRMVDVGFASAMAKLFLIDPNRSSQRVFMEQAPQIQLHPDPEVARIQEWIGANLGAPIGLDTLADRFAMGKRTLIRRFKAALHETPLSYIQKLRIDRAKQLLEGSELALEEIVPMLGYEDISSFRKLFVQHTSLTPKAYRERFRSQHGCCDASP
ncbi:helix-turn-helix domain-containing protein [Shewanella sp. JM162201]|uniref:Helix-turn-helix domain-containing protein n=1 Tax=Shewanella jiangmenensis TaxID=2837387 RepID=A0ABS5V5H6_9GAMM|nr:helix-turn-helix domain-containing protein [Shewanella jiangmenensis]MBT1445082.1 helix-turn-helix domain-containing protein [Shewanella jiangmenensis]